MWTHSISFTSLHPFSKSYKWNAMPKTILWLIWNFRKSSTKWGMLHSQCLSYLCICKFHSYPAAGIACYKFFSPKTNFPLIKLKKKYSFSPSKLYYKQLPQLKYVDLKKSKALERKYLILCFYLRGHSKTTLT